MNLKMSLQSKENQEKRIKTKFALLLTFFVMALLCLMINSAKVSALSATITGTSYKQDGTNFQDFPVKILTSSDDRGDEYSLTFVQGNGKDSEVAIKFTVAGFTSTIDSFVVVESEHSDSDDGDLDRYTWNGTSWVASNIVHESGIVGSATPHADDPTTLDIVYRIRKGSYGLQFLKLFLYDYHLEDLEEDDNGVYELEVFYVISQPVNTLPNDIIASESCSTEEDADTQICLQYEWDGSPQREPRPLKVYIPKTIAYKFAVADEDEALTTYMDKTISTIYAINYFEEKDGEINVVETKDAANRSYLYVNFAKYGSDTTETFESLVSASQGAYLSYRVGTANAYNINSIAYLSMDIDAKGTYFFYVVDLFGNVKEVNTPIDNVINRTLYTEIEKGNASDPNNKIGYSVEELASNKSVSVSLTMTVETKFEYGQCLIQEDEDEGINIEECAKITNLTEDQVKYVKYWRVDVQIVNGKDVDAYDEGDLITDRYASHIINDGYVYNNQFYYIYCNSAYVGTSGCAEGTTVQTWDSSASAQTSETNAGFASFTGNTLTMYLALNGRYRFYIEDIQGNNTWGEEGDLAAQEYRNPRVEIYGIDKSAPEIIFEHDQDNTKTVGLETLIMYDIETYEFYKGIEQAAEDGKFVYTGTMSGSPDVGEITTGIYYPINRDAGRTGDNLFSDLMALVRSKVRATEYVYYYTGNPIKEEFSDYSVYDRESGAYYVVQEYDNSRSATILKNTKNNSFGLLDEDDKFEFGIKYYHNAPKNDGSLYGICEYLGTIMDAYAEENELVCVNYYLDHGVDFIIEFEATDTVGNTSFEKVYVNVVDTTPAGFTLVTDEEDNTKYIKSSNIGTDCRMEMGSIIGDGTKQNKTAILKCYNVILVDGEDLIYNFEDNVYDAASNSGLKFANRINSNSYVKLYMASDVEEDEWVDLEESQFIPNETGYYDMKIEIYDNTPGVATTNVLTVLVSYYVDKKIVLIQPNAEEKFYGESDLYDGNIFDYCVWINNTNEYDVGYFTNPYAEEYINDFSKIYCSNNTPEQIASGKSTLFRNNIDKADFTGGLTRLESEWYNANLTTPNYIDDSAEVKVGIENNYVGLYRIILGTLNITKTGTSGEEHPDYVVKIDPRTRDSMKYKGSENDNLVTNDKFEDDNPYAQSNVDFTIKQVMLTVTANGGNKNYGATDTNFAKYDSDAEQTLPYLNGYTVAGLKTTENSGVHYNDSRTVVLGVLRREVGEDVGVYYICNYRGLSNIDKTREDVNDMYTDCADLQNSGWTIIGANPDGSGGEYKQTNGIIDANADYVKSRALYIATNKTAKGKTLNVTTDTRNNGYANYVIQYVGSTYEINPIDLVVQAAPGQRREYNHDGVVDPNPWEIVLYGLVDFSKKTDGTFNGYTIDAPEYTAAANQKDVETDEDHVSKWEANQSEERDAWKLVHNSQTLYGYKTNETYSLLRATASGAAAGSAKLIRTGGNTGGWYLYYSLGNDVYVGATENRSNISDIAIITNGNKHCSYAANGHTINDVGIDESYALCKNYNLVYNDYYTNEDGYTYETKLESHAVSEFIYVSNGEKCTVADPGLPCPEAQKYNIQFEIYRREIIMEFNSALETILLEEADSYEIVYGKRYTYYDSNLFDISFYDGKKHNGTNILPEDYLFICYQNESTRSNFTAGDASTGCTGDWKYGLTKGDSWSNIGLSFWMHSAVSATTSGYHGSKATDKAIPAGVYYVYADIDSDQKANYNFIYKGGALTIKSKSVNVQITSYQKEYGEAYYSSYGVGSNYGSYTSFANLCMNDGLFIYSQNSLVGKGLMYAIANGDLENISCGDHDASNSSKNIYGFYIEAGGLDDLDTIADNFTGRPTRARSSSSATDKNALQDNVGIYDITDGTIQTRNNNPFYEDNACATIGDITNNSNKCVVVIDQLVNNYVINTSQEADREYVFDMQLIDDIRSKKNIIGNPTVTTGYLFITPATLTIKVTSGQTKMYGCAYNTVNKSNSVYTYDYSTGYANCVETEGDYYDLGYEYTVYGDKDYAIANSNDGYDYGDVDDYSYPVSGIKGKTTFRYSVQKNGIKPHALNDYGTLYRVPVGDYTTGLTNVKLKGYASSAQATTNKTYQVQVVGNYIITLGNVDAAVNDSRGTMKNKCDENNMPSLDGTYACKNYHVDYYGTNTNSNSEDAVVYLDENDATPTELYFTITTRKAYMYTNHDEKIYMDEDPNKKYLCGDYNLDGKVDLSDNVDEVNGDVYYRFCTQDDVDNEVVYEYGLTRYYTKTNSLAKAPWNGIEGRDDVQHDIIGGKLSRKGEPNGEGGWKAPSTDDIRGFYEYVYEKTTYGGTVALNAYGSNNYTVNYYNGDGLAVNINGEVQNEDDEELIKFEIVFRQIQIAFVSFTKVYGEEDNVEDYDILVCAPTDTFDFDNMKCIVNDATDPHGLGNTHKTTYLNEDKTLKQELFKTNFVVRYKRVLGENVSCENTTDISGTLSGYFYGSTDIVTEEGTKYKYQLTCADGSGYQTLAYIDQSSNAMPGYNYQVTYTIGQVNIAKRKILISPTPGQGFVYGDYNGTLIPAIEFSDSIGDGNVNTRAEYGLVNNGDTGEGVCLKNINGYNNGGNGTCFYINDRKDTYNSKTSMTTSAYDAAAVNADTGLENEQAVNYVFGDVYTSESSSRSALQRQKGTSKAERYNRNVGEYTIILGDEANGGLRDQTGNYEIQFTENVKYTITHATITIVPDSTEYSGTTQNNQYKIYGEQDKELTFTVTTSYKVKYTHYALYDSAIVKVCPEGATADSQCTFNEDLERYNPEDNTKIANGTHILLLAGSTVLLNGYAYNESDPDKASANLDYGSNKAGEKKVQYEAINQASITDSEYYDIVCKDIDENTGCSYLDPDTNAQVTPTLSYGDTSRILLGYLHVANYAQSAGTYKIVSGFRVALNEWNEKNYQINFAGDVDFTIIPRPVGVQIQNVTKTYGQATDSISCDGATCTVDSGILHADSEGYLKNNFTIETFNNSTRIASILGNNSTLYSQNSTFVNGLVTQAAYSQYNTAETKNSNKLGVYVSRDERNRENEDCLYSGDKYGFCEDAGDAKYSLRFYGYYNAIDNISANNYQTVFKPTSPGYTGAVSSVNKYYYNSYWGYNPNYFVIVVDNDATETAVKDVFVDSANSTSRSVAPGSSEKLLKSTGTLTINRKKVAMYVNTHENYLDGNPEIYYIQQNTNPPSLPTIDNTIDLDYKKFMEGNKQEAVSGYDSYGNVIWGSSPKQVRTKDKLVGELAYCDVIISANSYYSLRDDGISSDYSCTNLIYEDNKNGLNTHLEGYVPIVRNINSLSIVAQGESSPKPAYENKNYEVQFYPGGLRIDEDDVKPVVEVNRSDVYIEANAVGTYLYECVGSQATTTYKDCDLSGTNISIQGKTELVIGDPILDILNELGTDTVIKVSLPTIEECEQAVGHQCTASAYYQLLYGKGQDGFVNNGGIKNGIESGLVTPFTMQKDSYVKNAGPNTLKELIITLVKWFGVTAYDAGEIRDGQYLDKHFDKYWYIIIEENGTNGKFEINKVGEYKVHFYVMDNAGNVSEGNMYLDEDNKKTGTVTETMQDAHTNVATLHIIDTTKPVVGTLNLYSGKVKCDAINNDCSLEANWVVAENMYVPLNTLGRYDANGDPAENGEYIYLGNGLNSLTRISTINRYSLSESGTYVVDNSQGKHILVAAGTNARAIKHYSWTNSSAGVYLTITGGSDNSYTENKFPQAGSDDTQWNHYYSRDNGITWFLYERDNMDNDGYISGYLALDNEGSREILIKAVDSGVKLTKANEKTINYIKKSYPDGTKVTDSITTYEFEDTSIYDEKLKEIDDKLMSGELSEEQKQAEEEKRHEYVDLAGWNLSDWALNDETMAARISLTIYGTDGAIDANENKYMYYRDKQTAYLDRTKPVVELGEGRGKDIYLYEYGCGLNSCKNGYTEYYAGAKDSVGSTKNENRLLNYDMNNTIFINHSLTDPDEEKMSYISISGENINVPANPTGTNAVASGLGADQYAMKGATSGQDIRDIYVEERRYIINAFDANKSKTVYDLSNSIPTNTDDTDEDYIEAEENIYDIIPPEIDASYNKGDFTYTVIYSVIDKAGNESIYIARGVIFSNLIPQIEIEVENNEVQEVEENVYMLNVSRGDSLESVKEKLNVSATTGFYNKIQYLNQTVYYNGELIEENRKYNENIHKDFDLTTPGVYEIIYSLSYEYIKDGQSEIMIADPVKLIINIEATPPTVLENNVNYMNLIYVIMIMIGSAFICLIITTNKRRI